MRVIGKDKIDLPTEISFEEARELAVKVSALKAALDKAEAEEETKKKELKANVQRAKKEHDESAFWLRQMKLPKATDVEYHLDGSQVRTVRLDTGEVAAVRPATKEDLQVPAFGEPLRAVKPIRGE